MRCHSRLARASWNYSGRGYYQWILREKLRRALRGRRSDLLREGVILLHDNASSLFKASVVQTLYH